MRDGQLKTPRPVVTLALVRPVLRKKTPNDCSFTLCYTVNCGKLYSLYIRKVVVLLTDLVLLASTSISGMTMMWISFYSIGFMLLASGLIYLSRQKISNSFFRSIVAFIAYIFLIIGFLTMVFVVMSF